MPWCTTLYRLSAGATRPTVRQAAGFMPLGGDRSPNQRQVCKPSDSEIDGGHRMGHADAMDKVARSLPDIARLSRCLLGERLQVAAAGPEMAGKASEPF